MQITPISTVNQYNINNKKLSFKAVNKNITEELLKKSNIITDAIKANKSNLTNETAKVISTAFEGIIVALGLNKIVNEKKEDKAENNIKIKKSPEDIEKEKIFEKTKKIITKITDTDEEIITPQKDLKMDLGFDSLENTEILMSVEEDFGIKIKNKHIEKLRNIQNLVDIIYSETSKKK